MNFNEFVNEVKDNIKLFLPRDYENAEVSTMECHKLNRAYTGLMVRKEGEMLTPTINLNRLYEAYKAQPGVTMETVCRKIADIVIEAPIQVDLKAILNYEDVKDKLFIRVSSAEANKEALEVLEQEESDPENDEMIEIINSTVGKLQQIEDKYYYSLDLNYYLNNLEDDAYEA